MTKKITDLTHSALVLAVTFSAALLFTFSVAAEPQSVKVPRLGVLSGGSSTGQPLHDAFRQGLRALGYIEGQNIIIEYRYAEGKLDRLQISLPNWSVSKSTSSSLVSQVRQPP